MNEYVLVEFLFELSEYVSASMMLNELGGDFISIRIDEEWESENGVQYIDEYIRVSGKINSAAATLIKLQNPYLAGKMRISYISDDLKNKYRL
jgi:hypothetical protein